MEHLSLAETAPKRKSYQEKAAERNYYQDKNGDWWESSGDDFFDDERVNNFKLDVEYPDLADQAEILAQKYGAKYSDFSGGGGGLKGLIYRHAAELSTADASHLENIFRITSQISESTTWKNGRANELLLSHSAPEISQIADHLDQFYEGVEKASSTGFSRTEIPFDIGTVAEYFVARWNKDLAKGDFIHELAEFTARAYDDKENGHLIIREIKDGIIGITDNADNGDAFGEHIEYGFELAKNDHPISKYNTYFAEYSSFVKLHGVNHSIVSGFKNIIFPLLEQQDPETRPILTDSNSHGMYAGVYGISDYAEKCFISHHRPAEINELIRIYHEIPTSDYQKFEQNRKDAARLQSTIIGGRDFIHDELPGTHELLQAMQDYYDHQGDEDIATYADRIREINDRYGFSGTITSNTFELDLYDRPVEYMGESYSNATGGAPDETAIDILRRLVKNTTPDLATPPETKYPSLNAALAKIHPTLDEKTGVVNVSLSEVGPAVAELNSVLMDNYGDQGVFPSTVSAISFLDKMSAHALRKSTPKDIAELAFDPNFKEIVRFSWLTSSTKYNDTAFEANYQKLLTECSRGYGSDSIDRDKIRDGYRFLSQTILENMQSLASHYTAKKTTSRFKEAIWSGNLADELIGLFQRA